MTGIESLPAPDAAVLSSFAGSDDGRTVVWMQGEHDVCTAAALSKTMGGAMGSTTPTSSSI